MIPREIFEETLLNFFAPVRPYLDDPTVSEIMINGPEVIYIERGGRLELTPARFDSQEALNAAIRNLAQFVGRHVSEERPILEGRFPDGSRVEVVMPPAGPEGPHIAIRRFSKKTITPQMLVEWGSMTAEAMDLVAGLVACKQNIMVAGGTGSGKTSMLNAVSSFIDPSERVIVIEDSRELQLQQPHVVQLEARPPDAKGRGQVTIRDLFKATLRMRPDRIVVGEIRGGEALELVQAMISGHGGGLSTVHATYPTDTLNRLETLAMMADVSMPLTALRAQIASAINIILQTARLQDGSRCVTHLTEVTGYDPEGGYERQDLYVRKIIGKDQDGRIRSILEPTGASPRCAEMMEALRPRDW
jgi:pilus assembly protein CpaF